MQVQVVRKWEKNMERDITGIFDICGTYVVMVIDDETGKVLRQAEGRTEAAARRQLLGLVTKEIKANG